DGAGEEDRLVALAEQARRGDVRALELLFLLLLPRTRNLVRYLVRNERDADDATQMALVALARGLPSFAGRGKFRSWVDRIVARATFRELQKGQAERRLLLHVDSQGMAPGGVPDRAQEYVFKRWLAQLLDQLPIEQRTAFVLHHVVGMTVGEIAEET